MNALGLEHKNSEPTCFSIPKDISSFSKLKKLELLHEAAGIVVDKFVFRGDGLSGMINNILTTQEREEIINSQELTDDGRFPCRFQGCSYSFKDDGKSRRKHELTHNPSPVIQECTNLPITSEKPNIENTDKAENSDDMFNYNCALLTDGLFFLNFLDAVSEGDGQRLMRQYKLFLLYCKADGEHSTKYALESLYQFFLIFAQLSPRDVERFIWNRTANNGGGKGKNIALDLEQEHSNNYLKQAVKNLGPNLNEQSVSRICRAEKETRNLVQALDRNLQQNSDSGKHYSVSLDRDLSKLVQRLVSNRALEKEPARQYSLFSTFERNPFKNLDTSKIYKWINGHKKNVNIGIKAR